MKTKKKNDVLFCWQSWFDILMSTTVKQKESTVDTWDGSDDKLVYRNEMNAGHRLRQRSSLQGWRSWLMIKLLLASCFAGKKIYLDNDLDLQGISGVPLVRVSKL